MLWLWLTLSSAGRTAEDLVMQLLVLKILYLLFTTKGCAEYFYTNDLCVLVDVFLREILNLDEDNESVRHYQRTSSDRRLLTLVGSASTYVPSRTAPAPDEDAAPVDAIQARANCARPRVAHREREHPRRQPDDEAACSALSLGRLVRPVPQGKASSSRIVRRTECQQHRVAA
jgi:hypothetical protein